MKNRTTTFLFLLLLVATGLTFWHFNSVTTTSKSKYQSVLKYYSCNLSDSLKLKAAHFLINNLQYHYGIPNYLVDSLGNKIKDFNGLQYPKDSLVSEFSELGYRFQMQKPVPDIESLTPEYLIQNIELAFKVWPKPWNKHIKFEEFCEYILPYRVQNEPLSDWREYFYKKYIGIAESMVDDSLFTICSRMQDTLKNSVFYSDKINLYNGFIDPFELEKIRYGACEQLSVYAILALRAIGIPAIYQEVMYWSSVNKGHVNTTFIEKDSVRYYNFSVSDGPPKRYNPKSGKQTGSVRTVLHYFSKKQDYALVLKNLKEDYPQSLFNEFIEDMPPGYSTSDPLSIKISGYGDNKLAYLCTFNMGEWKPVRWSQIWEDGSCRFENVTKTVIYSVGTYTGQGMDILTDPFIFYEEDSICYKNPSRELIPKITFPFYVSDSDKSIKKKVTGYYMKNKQWIPIYGTAILSKRKRVGGKEEWTACEVEEIGEKNVYYLGTFDNVPANAVFYGGGISRLYLPDSTGWYIRR